MYYRHFKGNLYKFITESHDSETGEVYIVYQEDKPDGKVWHRKADIFHGYTEDGVKRFKYDKVALIEHRIKEIDEKIAKEKIEVKARLGQHPDYYDEEEESERQCIMQLSDSMIYRLKDEREILLKKLETLRQR